MTHRNQVPEKIVWNPGNDKFVRARGLYFVDPTDATEAKQFFNNTATVKATLLDQFGNAVVGCVDVPMNFVSSGFFVGTVDNTFRPPEGTGYTLFIEADQGTAHGEWNIDVEITKRKI